MLLYSEELDQKREIAKQNSTNYLYDGKCRDLVEEKNLPFVVRLRIEKNKKLCYTMVYKVMLR